MKKTNPLIRFASVLAICGFAGSASALSVTTSGDGNALAQALVGAGVSISNVNYTGTATSSGFFSGGVAAGIGIESGVVLTTGSAASLNTTSNISDSTSTNNGLPGDAVLNALFGVSTQDATVLAFDFTPTAENVFFSYVFASEEYNEFANSSFNDVFAFQFEGANVALIPGTSTQVSINTVNGGNPLGVNAQNPEFYNNNDPSDGGAFPFAYDGFTDVFTATLSNLTPGQVYSIHLAIADVGDSSWDSGVFLAAESFSTVDPTDPPVNPIPEPGAALVFGSALLLVSGAARKRA